MMAASGFSLQGFSRECDQELVAIADWWVAHSQDSLNGGFWGEVGEDNQPVPEATKGIVLNTRILWFFSEVARVIPDPLYRQLADRAWQYLINHFVDREHGGVFWELDARGQPLNTKKQVYAQAFAIYALVAYYQLSENPDALRQALSCFELLEHHTIDREREGYFEAFTREWGKIEDVRLSDKDLNYPKSMNTHLHVLEAYTALNRVHPVPVVAEALRYNIHCFDKYIIDRDTWHMRMFMDVDWKDFSPGFTYGHDIETAWLLVKALDSLNDPVLRERLLPDVIAIADTCLREAIGEHGQVIDAYDFASRRHLPEIIWWVQAEAMVGFLKVASLCGEQRFIDAAVNVWEFIKKYQIDHQQGEWLWASRLDKPHGQRNYKMGFWKGPYHNGRAMMEAKAILATLQQ